MSKKTSLSLLGASSQRKYLGKSQEVLALPNLIEIQRNSYDWFLKKGLRELLDEINPIEDFTGKALELSFGDYYLEEPKYTERQAKEKNATYEASLKVKAELKNKITGRVREQEIYLGDFPIMTTRGSFVINGVERVVVTQLVRSAGAFFNSESIGGEEYFGAKIIPNRGAWLEIETSPQNIISVKIDRKRKIPITTLLRAFGFSSNEEIKKAFADVNTNKDRDYITSTLDKDPAANQSEAYVEVYKRIRPGDLATVENARSLIDAMFKDFKRYDLSRVGRYKLNKRLGLDVSNDKENWVLRPEDLVEIIREVIRLNNGIGKADDIDHLGNRRLRAVGELIQQRFRVGLLRMERIIKDRMSIIDPNAVTPAQLINNRPVMASLREFFASSQLSQFADQTNPLAELVHKRRLSAMGPGGLSRERAGFEVRDVHRTHYSRICPIETPEGPNIGLVNSLASYTKINEYGFMVAPYRKVLTTVQNNPAELAGKIIAEDIEDAKGKVMAKAGEEVSKETAEKIGKLDKKTVKIKPLVKKEVVYLDAYDDERYINAQATTKLDEKGYIIEDRVSARVHGQAGEEFAYNIDYMDVSSKQIVSVAASLIPFLEHDDAARALMGANMQRQAVALIKPDSPIVGTGVEQKVAEDSGHCIYAERDGVVTSVSASQIGVTYNDGEEKTYLLNKFVGSNQDTSINQRAVAENGDEVKKGDLLVDGPSIQAGELALGQNVLVAYMSWGGANYEDAIIISERLVKDDVYTSVHIEKFTMDIRDTKLGPEVITRDIPNVGEEALRDLDEDGIVRIGAQVTSGDILVGKITPKGETELTAEERLLRAIFGEKARDVKDTSLRLPTGEHGKIIGITIFARDKGDELPAGVIKRIEVSVAQMRKISVGDKMAGRHGNKGVISKVLPVADMPYLEDGTPIDIILSPLGIVSRMNLGQILETHLGWAASRLGEKIATPVFEGATIEIVQEYLKKAGLPVEGKVTLYNGRTGEPFKEKITVGKKYMLKLSHLVEDKMHARSTGPYAMVTQQPLGGKAQMGGQRFGEMEVWALEAYGAAHTLQEILTIKSDDVIGRSKAYEAIIKGEEIKEPRVPESFNVLVKELQALGLSVELLDTEKPKAKVMDADDVIEKGYEDEAKSIESPKLLEAESESAAAEGLPIVDTSNLSEIDDFEALDEAAESEASYDNEVSAIGGSSSGREEEVE
ncbi:TPA: DNA-directed RNA polymerase subunit beta [candidate division CPR2 bacterium]|uniref:DNA-directed RNA polymerase subunit beta n=1 Tax=candidate division CPR2 bacterium GW2011_GWC1_41_48 TaxID=1618344 RepID=A0A0G0YGZ7_UNCC2|nr:MAG: DNA-directed RNA polymerase subunit beta [candidate division CPR2 bacterium GW2011_GWC2_39_35]KKR27711.1 MAG: DNA-directed RNA polymerase subunit beta [candidate division CPR2 bacterium GW2011_GWD2_39_7]KKS08826.1 MAG: DNA-directed RNA polymerase, beta subunit, DNA-directed RNA polymerase subunit beta [candidate division CPR2 bacterium GW2011_GWC1_41_48]OGB71778.1 MAG: DNA-directed RNA polymerase subunit beta [candidate division CPR2 bacterium GWD2_39_7]HBG81309.1 DNA-directed RNA polym